MRYRQLYKSSIEKSFDLIPLEYVCTMVPDLSGAHWVTSGESLGWLTIRGLDIQC